MTYRATMKQRGQRGQRGQSAREGRGRQRAPSGARLRNSAGRNASAVSHVARATQQNTTKRVEEDLKNDIDRDSGSGSGSNSVSRMSAQIRAARAQLDEDEQLSVLMRGLRGADLNDDDFAAQGVEMKLVNATSIDTIMKGSNTDSNFNDATESLPLVYDPARIAAFWSVRPVSIISRVLQLSSIIGGLVVDIASDVVFKKMKQNEVLRARQVREIVTSLGPAYIKLGQALSIRPDLLGPAAMREMQKLCDKVPSFDNEVAMKLIRSELKLMDTNEVFEYLSPEPVAAASLGQVYKGKLRKNGDVVAVKVQRPQVLETVTIDLFIIRTLALELRKFPAINTDFVALLDEWAERFFEELDYVNEGNNATKFADMMKDDLPQIVVPKTYHELTSRRVITSEWIEGEKLSQSTEDDVGSLVNVGVICYLKQLLDTGFFHADPHPGNMIRTPDGRLAILDFGLMTQIDDGIKFGMIEAIAHLIHRDYEGIVEDFVTLDFIPEGVNLTPILPVLTRVFDQALDGGGGAKNINFQELAADLAQITFDYPFRIPPYFALIIRAISVLEGIALVGNPDFAIVDEAYPYISKRLLTDESPRLRAALRYIIYGKNDTFDAERIIDVLQAFEDYGVSSKLALGSGSQSTSVNVDTGVRLTARSARLQSSTSSQPISRKKGAREEALEFIFSRDGVFFRELLMDELVKAVDALSRESLAQLFARLGLSSVRVPLLLPFAPRPTLPLSPIISEQDQVVARNMTMVISFLLGQSPDGKNSASDPSSLSKIVLDPSLAAELLPYLPAASREVIPELYSRLISRVSARVIRDVYGISE